MQSQKDHSLADDADELLHRLKNGFHTARGEHILKPVAGQGHVVMHKAGATAAHPHIHAELFFDEFSIDFNSAQYRDVLWTALTDQSTGHSTEQ